MFPSESLEKEWDDNKTWPPPPPSWEEVSSWVERSVTGTWRINPATGKIDVDGDFSSTGLFLRNFPEPGFGKVTGHFSCQYLHLTSLIGSPQFVGGSFHCYENDLESLVGGPTSVGGNYIFSGNPIKSLEGAPAEIGLTFDCHAFAVLEWTPENLTKTFFGKALPFFHESAPELIFPLLTIRDIANHLKQFPLDIDLLDNYPDCKKMALKESGIPDFTDLARATRMGLV
jgi:hypothetical protein